MSEADFAQAIADQAGASIVVRYLIIAECIGEDGTTYLAEFKSPGMAYWDVIGMCTATAQSAAPQPNWTEGDE